MTTETEKTIEEAILHIENVLRKTPYLKDIDTEQMEELIDLLVKAQMQGIRIGRKDERQKVLKEVKAWAESHIKEKPHRMYSWLSDVVRYCNEALAQKEGDEK